MKNLTIVIVAIAAAGLAFGAGEQEGAGSSTIDMDMWLSVDVSPDQLWGGPGRDFIATVEENYPHIDLTFTTVGERDLVPQFIAAYGAGEPPDIVQQYSSGTTKMVNGGYFRAVDDLFATYEGKDNFREGTLDAYTYDGKLYGIPAIGGHPLHLLLPQGLVRGRRHPQPQDLGGRDPCRPGDDRQQPLGLRPRRRPRL